MLRAALLALSVVVRRPSSRHTRSALITGSAISNRAPQTPVATLAAAMSGKHLKVKKQFGAPRQREGAGFVIRRGVGTYQLSDEEADPFLLLDELGPASYKPGEFPGAPWHPHRGFDTVMYLKQGEGRHNDSMGNSGILRAGDCQWMTAGSGIIHDEGRDHPGGVLHGFQMWVNLPKSHKMTPPKYQDIPAEKIPVVEAAPGVSAKVIAGECAGRKAVVQTVLPVQYIDFVAQPGASFTHTIPAEMETVIVYVYTGAGKFTDKSVDAADGEVVLLGGGDTLSFTSVGKDPLSFLLLAGKPTREPIVRQGPFVMNTREEIQQAFMDYQNGTLTKHKAQFRTEF